MGLAGRKTKQRIGADPRNLTWSDDSSKFGAKYLQSLGWTSGTGLGATGDGRTNNLKIHQKLDLMGIGANRRGPGGDDAGWRGGREFEGLLARLNQAQDDTHDIPIDEDATKIHDSVKAEQSELLTEANDHSLETSHDAQATKITRKNVVEKKRKRSTTEDSEVDAKEAKRRRKEEKKKKEKEKREKKAEKAAKKLKAAKVSESQEQDDVSELPPAQSVENVVKVAPRFRAHRARNIASKRLAAASLTGMNEILGIASSITPNQTSSIPFPSLYISPRQHLSTKDAEKNATHGLGSARAKECLEYTGATETIGGGLGLGVAGEHDTGNNATRGDDMIRKNGKSVAEYFAEKMRKKSAAKGVSVSGK